MNISVEKAKQIREDIGATHLILLARASDGEENVSTHGLTEQQAHEAAHTGNRLKKLLGWPDELCQATPAQRAEWNRKTAPEILAQIEALRIEGQEYADNLDNLSGSPDDAEERDTLYVSMAQCRYAIQQLEWVLKPNDDEAQELPTLYPKTLTPELDEVLGWPNFKCGGFADAFRAAGYDIPRKAEREQAFVLHWLTGLVLKHGAGWRNVALSEFEALREKVVGKGELPND